MITGIGIADLLVRDRAKRNSFQLKAMQMTQAAASPGSASGSTIQRKDWKCDAPSTRAASSSSRGNSRNVWLRMITANGIVKVALSRTSAQTESRSPNWRISRKNGVTNITGGSTRWEINQVVKAPLLGRLKRKRAKA